MTAQRIPMSDTNRDRSHLSRSDIGRFMEMLQGYQRTAVLVTAVQIGLVDRLREGPADEGALVEATGAHALSLSRLLRGLRVLGMVERKSDGKMALTGRGRLLSRRDLGIHDLAIIIGDEYMAAWGQLRHAVMTGKTGFEHRFGMTAWEHRVRHPHLNEAFNNVMSGDQIRTLKAIADSYDLTGRRCLVDVGGGAGDLIAGILKRRPELKGILLDQPHVVEGAPAILAAAGVADRCTVVGGSFLEAVPRGGDVYILKHVLHNWDDDDCVRILRNCVAVMDPGAALLVLEDVLPDEETEAAIPLVMLDLHMMTALGGRERTQTEYGELFAAAGLTLVRCIATASGASDVIEAKRGS
jgi:hypothetical protein